MTQAWAAAEESIREEIPVSELDDQMKSYLDAREDYDAKKKVSNEADAVCKEEKRKLVELLKRAGKTSWDIEGVGKASITNRTMTTVPKDPEAKKEMLAHFRQLGPDRYLHYVSVNSMTLNSYINQELENDPSFQMPGCELPTVTENITFRRKK